MSSVLTRFNPPPRSPCPSPLLCFSAICNMRSYYYYRLYKNVYHPQMFFNELSHLRRHASVLHKIKFRETLFLIEKIIRNQTRWTLLHLHRKENHLKTKQENLTHLKQTKTATSQTDRTTCAVPTWKFQTILNTHKIKRGIEKSKDKTENVLKSKLSVRRFNFLIGGIPWHGQYLVWVTSIGWGRRSFHFWTHSHLLPLLSLSLQTPCSSKGNNFVFQKQCGMLLIDPAAPRFEFKSNKMFPTKEDGTRFKAALDRSWVGFFPRNGKKQKNCEVGFGI